MIKSKIFLQFSRMPESW